MEFCDKCGALMLPKKVGTKTVLRCRECGFEKPLKQKDEDYRVEFRIEHSPHEKIVIVEDSQQRLEDLSEDEKRERRKQILEFLELEETD